MKTPNTKIGGLLEIGHFKLLLLFFVIALLSRGGVLSRGFSIDDYFYGHGLPPDQFKTFFSQARILLAALDWVINSLGVNLTDIYVSLGLVSLLLQAGLVLSVLRFVGAADRPGAAIAGSLMIAHPYLSEILTFRMALPGYCVGALLTIIVLESASGDVAKKYRNLLISLTAAVAMLFVYQVFLNYFSAALIFALLFGEIFTGEPASNGQPLMEHRRRALNLLLVSGVSIAIFVAVVAVAKQLAIFEMTSSAKFIKLQDLPERISQIFAVIERVYWLGEPTGAHWVKVATAAMLAAAGLAVAAEVLLGAREDGPPMNRTVVLLALLLLALATIGVILPFKVWWPVPRVLPQTSLIIGLIFLLAYPIWRCRLARIPKAVFMALPVLLIICSVLKSNQIFTDQLRLTSWDKMKANRIVARLEQMDGFPSVEYVFVGRGEYKYPLSLSTIQGDMQISGFYPKYSKVQLLAEASGYDFKPATGEQVERGEIFCKAAKTWPNEGSISIIGNLAVVCLGESI